MRMPPASELRIGRRCKRRFWRPAVMTLALGTYWLMQPASADRLFERIAAAAETGDIEKLRDKTNDINSFLAHYGDDARAPTVRQHKDDIDLYLKETPCRGPRSCGRQRNGFSAGACLPRSDQLRKIQPGAGCRAFRCTGGPLWRRRQSFRGGSRTY